MSLQKAIKKFKCRFNLNGDCQLYSMPCERAEMCELEVECKNCKYELSPKQAEPCARCDERSKEDE